MEMADDYNNYEVHIDPAEDGILGRLVGQMQVCPIFLGRSVGLGGAGYLGTADCNLCFGSTP